MKIRTLGLLALALPVLLISSSCGPEQAAETPVADTPTPTEAPTSSGPVEGVANVESIEILILESFPVQVNVRARGQLPDGCTNIDEVTTEASGTAFDVTISTFRPADAVCTEAVVPFEEVIALDVVGLEADTYTVNVNGIRGTFTLAADNVPETAEPTPDADAAAISGRIWHDQCAVADGEGDAQPEPSEGCIAVADGGFQANGLVEEGEPGIEGVVVSLGEGECPADGLDTTTTDADGEYIFTDLDDGTYCVSVDPLDETNTEILVPGSWTFPESDVNNAGATISEGESQAGVNFGWDYQFLPIPEVDQATCTRSIEFIEDLSIPDNTILAPGEEFEKSWRLRNNGTCPWTTEYSLVTVGGDDIPGPDSVPLSEPVAPGQTVDFSVAMNAPAEPGTYEENWQISDATGQPFGVNGFIENAFSVQIVVEEGAPPGGDTGEGTIGGVVWEDVCFLNADGTPSAGCVETAEGSGFYRADGTLNFNEPVLPGVTAILAEEACPLEGAIPEASILDTTVTDEEGLYRFTGLGGNTYCVSIDAFSAENINQLIPGDWTWPAPGLGRIGIRLAAGEERLNVDFGWDYQE